MIKTILLLLIATASLAQTTQIVTGNNFHIKTLTEIKLKAGSSGSISLTDTSKAYNFQPEAGVTTLYYSTTPPTTPPNPTPGTITVQAESYLNGTNVEKVADGNRQIIRPVNGGVAWTTVYNTFTISGQKSLLVTYSNGNTAATAFTLTVGTTVINLSLPSTTSWGVYQTANLAFTGTGAVSISYKSGANVDLLVFK